MKEYCTQNNGNCNTCSLVNYGRDCLNKPLNKEDLEGIFGKTINENDLKETIKELKSIYEETTSDLQGIAIARARDILKKSNIPINSMNVDELTEDILEGVYN